MLQQPNIFSTVLFEEEEEDKKDINELFLEEFYNINNDFIYIEPKLIPIIPGINPNLFNRVSEINEDNFEY